MRTNFTLQAQHAEYPRAGNIWLDNWEWQTARMHILQCLRKANVAKYEKEISPADFKTKLQAGLFGKIEKLPNGTTREQECVRMEAGVDFAKYIYL